MSDQPEEQQQEQPEVLQLTKEELDNLVNEKIQGLAKKNDELLTEVKQYKHKAREVQSEAEKAREEALKKSGDIEELKSFWENKNKQIETQYQEQLQTLKKQIKESRKHEVINQIVGDFVDSEAATFMLKNLVDVGDEGAVFKDFAGNIIADNAEDFRKWARTNPHMQYLVRGTQANGAGATGSRATDGKNAEMKRTDFDAMHPADKMKFIKSGGKLVD